MTQEERTAFRLLEHVVLRCGWGWLYAVNALENQYQYNGNKTYADAAHYIRSLQLLPVEERHEMLRDCLMCLSSGVVPYE